MRFINGRRSKFVGFTDKGNPKMLAVSSQPKDLTVYNYRVIKGPKNLPHAL